MKKKTVFGTVLLVLLVLQAQTVFANGESESSSRSNNTPQEPPPNDPWSSVVLAGETEPMFEGTIWAHIDDADDILEFRAGGRLVNRRIITIKNADGSIWNTIPASANGTWQRDGDVVKFVIHTSYYTLPGSSYRFYLYPSYREGKYYLQTQRIMGIAKNNRGGEYDFTLIPSTGATPSMAQQPTAPSSTTNVYVQPSTPAQSPAPAPAPSAPTFQTGTYGWSNSGQNMTMQFSAGIVTMHLNNRQVWYGTYRINGTQLVISVTNTISDYSRLLGMTYSYTITSNTSFSGSGETWVRTGY